MHLFCFTCAGGAATFFDPLRPFLEPSIEITSLEYAGHGKRMKENCYHDFKELVDDFYPHILETLYDQRKSQTYTHGESVGAFDSYALMGYSMGSISAVEILNKILEENKLPLPMHIFLAAQEPHTKRELLGFHPGEMDDLVRERTLRFGGIPESLINNRRFWKMYLPVFRADYSMAGRYDFARLALQTEIPVTIFYSEEDTPFMDIKQWERYFAGTCEFVRFDGNHFFMQKHYQEMAEIIAGRLLKVS